MGGSLDKLVAKQQCRYEERKRLAAPLTVRHGSLSDKYVLACCGTDLLKLDPDRFFSTSVVYVPIYDVT